MVSVYSLQSWFNSFGQSGTLLDWAMFGQLLQKLPRHQGIHFCREFLLTFLTSTLDLPLQQPNLAHPTPRWSLLKDQISIQQKHSAVSHFSSLKAETVAEEEILGHLAPQHVRQKGQVHGIMKKRESGIGELVLRREKSDLNLKTCWFKLIFFQTWGLSISQLVDLAKEKAEWVMLSLFFLCIYVYTYGFLSIPWLKSFNTLQAVYWDGIDYFRSSFACRESYHRMHIACLGWNTGDGDIEPTKNRWQGKSMMKYIWSNSRTIYCTLYTYCM